MRSTIKCDIILAIKKFIWGFGFMKTKIIYISGAEVFNMCDVRDAFDTVRRELGLGVDTVLFGVPVDAEDAFAGKFDSAKPMDNADIVAQDIIPGDEIVPEIEQENKPEHTKKKVEIDEIAPAAPVDEESQKEVIPILSVLGGDIKPELAQEIKVKENPIVMENIPVIDDIDINIDLSESDVNNDAVIGTDDAKFEEAAHNFTNFDAADIDDEISTIEPESLTIQDSEEDDNQLEQLLQSVQSLHEDKDETIDDAPIELETITDETDATLEKLATEFAENQDKIVNTTKNSARSGRIGKLKNILPFKKAKRTESNLMGDLFGWAGVAANDEEFGIPEFFPTAAKK